MRRLFLSSFCAVLMVAGPLAAADEGDPAKGKEVFMMCAGCHNTDTDDASVGPSLKGLFKRPKLTNGEAVTDANVRAVIDAGGSIMPAFKDVLTPEQKNNLLAYLKTL